MRQISGKTKITGIIGHPIAHTLSPGMHNTVFEKLQMDYVYVPFDVHPNELTDAIKSIKTLNITGVNVTIPHKEVALTLVDKVDEIAKRVGAINTIVNQDGKLFGSNTDVPGFLKDIKRYNIIAKDKIALVIGAGGAGKAVVAALIVADIDKIFIYDTDEKKVSDIVNKFPLKCESISSEIYLTYKSEQYNIVVNATPIGMHEGDKSPLKEGLFNKNCFYYDVVYNRKTQFLINAEKVEAQAVGGLGMLLYQGILSFECFTHQKPSFDIMYEALTAAIQGATNK